MNNTTVKNDATTAIDARLSKAWEGAVLWGITIFTANLTLSHETTRTLFCNVASGDVRYLDRSSRGILRENFLTTARKLSKFSISR